MPETQTQGLARLSAALQEFHKIDDELTVNNLLTFILTAQEPGITQPDLQARVGMSQSGIGRSIAVLSKFVGFNQPGHDLLDAVQNPRDRRHKIVGLTTKGERLATKLTKLMEG